MVFKILLLVACLSALCVGTFGMGHERERHLPNFQEMFENLPSAQECPYTNFEHGLNLINDGFDTNYELWFLPDVELDWADAHFIVNPPSDAFLAQHNKPMAHSTTGGGYFTVDTIGEGMLALSPTDMVRYFFTYYSEGVSCDTNWLSYTVPGVVAPIQPAQFEQFEQAQFEQLEEFDHTVDQQHIQPDIQEVHHQQMARPQQFVPPHQMEVEQMMEPEQFIEDPMEAQQFIEPQFDVAPKAEEFEPDFEQFVQEQFDEQEQHEESFQEQFEPEFEEFVQGQFDEHQQFEPEFEQQFEQFEPEQEQFEREQFQDQESHQAFMGSAGSAQFESGQLEQEQFQEPLNAFMSSSMGQGSDWSTDSNFDSGGYSGGGGGHSKKGGKQKKYKQKKSKQKKHKQKKSKQKHSGKKQQSYQSHQQHGQGQY